MLGYHQHIKLFNILTILVGSYNSVVLPNYVNAVRLVIIWIIRKVLLCLIPLPKKKKINSWSSSDISFDILCAKKILKNERIMANTLVQCACGSSRKINCPLISFCMPRNARWLKQVKLIITSTTQGMFGS